MYAAGALRARVYLVLQGTGGQFLTGMGLNWRYLIRRRVAWNGSVYPGNDSLCAVVYFARCESLVSAVAEWKSVFPCEMEPRSQGPCHSLFSVV